MGGVEDILMGNDSDDDSDVEEVAKPVAAAAAAAVAPPSGPPAAVAAQPQPQPTSIHTAASSTNHPAVGSSTTGPPVPGATAMGGSSSPNKTFTSNSELTNRLKNLYSPAGNAAAANKTVLTAPPQPPSGVAMVPPPQRGGGGMPPNSNNTNYAPQQQQQQQPPVVGTTTTTAAQQQQQQPLSRQQPSYGSSSGTMPPGNNYAPGSAPPPHMQQHQQHQQQQQHPPPRTIVTGVHPVGRVPAPLPKGRTTQRSAPPAQRVAAVPMPNSVAGGGGRNGGVPGMVGGPPPQQQHAQQQHAQQHQQHAQQHQQSLVGARQPVPDPFEPTPLTTIVARGTSSAGAPSSSSGSGQQQQQQQQQRMGISHNQYPTGHPSQQQQQQQRMMHPTHLSQQQQQQQQQQQMQQQQQQHARQPPHLSAPLQPNVVQQRPPSNSGTSAMGPPPVPQPSVVGVAQQQQQQQQQQQGGVVVLSEVEEKKKKEQFLMFTRVLMKYLEQRDKEMHRRAKDQIKECYEKNKSGDPEFKSLTQSMKSRLRAVVGEQYWRKAHDYLEHFLNQKKKQKLQQQQQQLQQGGAQQQQQPTTQQQHPTTQQQHPTTQQMRQVQQQQPPTRQGPIVVGRTTQSVAPPIVRPNPATAVVPTNIPPTPLTQSQYAAKKMPIAKNSTTPPPNPLAIPAAAAAQVAAPTAPPAAAPTTGKAALDAKKMSEAELKKKRNALARAKRAREKKEKEKQKNARENKKASDPVRVIATPQPSTLVPGMIGLPLSSGQPVLPMSAGTAGTAITTALGTASVESKPPSVVATTTPSTVATSATAVSDAKGTTTTTTTTKKKVKKKKKVVKAKPSSVQGMKKPIPVATREYNRLMEMVDHSVMIDVKSIPNLLSKDHKMDVNLEEEQRLLLYGDEEQRQKVKEITMAAAEALESNISDDATMEDDDDVSPLPWKLPAYYHGWGERNVVSIRTAWAKVRLPESEMQQAEKEQQEAEKARRERPMIMPSTQSSVETEKETSSPSITTDPVQDDTTNHVWYNEARAEQDPTLTMLSEATELYLKSIIEKAIGNARLRQNLDGVRLWHTLHSQHADPSNKKDTPPPALIRLGCDVRRQIALAEGNAAKTYQRMEEAITRQNDTFHPRNPNDPDAMLLEATSMRDLSKKPPLKSAVEDADLDAKRRYEVFGGKDSNDPPLGRVPKKARVMLQDIDVGALGNQTPLIRGRRRRAMTGLFRF